MWQSSLPLISTQLCFGNMATNGRHQSGDMLLCCSMSVEGEEPTVSVGTDVATVPFNLHTVLTKRSWEEVMSLTSRNPCSLGTAGNFALMSAKWPAGLSTYNLRGMPRHNLLLSILFVLCGWVHGVYNFGE